MKNYRCTFVLVYLFCTSVAAQSPAITSVRKHVQQNANSIILEFVNFLSLPDNASDTANIQKNAAFIMEMMNKRGLEKVQLLTASTSAVPPVVYGEMMVPGATTTLIFYAHYDGQPVNPAQWAKGLEPFKPQLLSTAIDNKGTAIPFPTNNNYDRNWRVYARSASDDKAGVDAILNAYDALKKKWHTAGM